MVTSVLEGTNQVKSSMQALVVGVSLDKESRVPGTWRKVQKWGMGSSVNTLLAPRTSCPMGRDRDREGPEGSLIKPEAQGSVPSWMGLRVMLYLLEFNALTEIMCKILVCVCVFTF